MHPVSSTNSVARELGISAVVGTSNATMRLGTGDWVMVDGGGGIVQSLGDDIIVTAGNKLTRMSVPP